MKGKIRIAFLFLAALLLFSACRTEETPAESLSAAESSAESVPEEVGPQSNMELFELLICSWQEGTHAELYRYTSKEMTALLDVSAFSELFDSISRVSGAFEEVRSLSVSPETGMDVYYATIAFAYATVDLRVSLSDVQVCGWVYDIRFRGVHEITENGVTQRYFPLKSDGNELNAVYTYAASSEPCPAVLLISGSGPNDYNETIGLLTPLEDIALGLAARGINSLRVDKRTLLYGDSLGDAGVGEEYLIDCRAALAYLKQQPETDSVYVLGHSLGGQIAAVLAAEDEEVQGMVLFNSTARHLADVACDQYNAADPANRDLYAEYAEAAKNATAETATGELYYYSASDSYWATYNALDIRETLEVSTLPTLVINSTYDLQSFAADLQLWEGIYADKLNVTIRVYDDISHFGYRMDASDPTVFYTTQPFPEELLEDFADFFLTHP